LDDGNPGWKRIEPRIRHVHRLGLAAENHLDASILVEFDDLRGHLIDDPDIVLGIDAHLLRLQESVNTLSELTHELAVAIELEKPATAVCDRA